MGCTKKWCWYKTTWSSNTTLCFSFILFLSLSIHAQRKQSPRNQFKWFVSKLIALLQLPCAWPTEPLEENAICVQLQIYTYYIMIFPHILSIYSFKFNKHTTCEHRMYTIYTILNPTLNQKKDEIYCPRCSETFCLEKISDRGPKCFSFNIIWNPWESLG